MKCYICDKTDWYEITTKDIPVHLERTMAICKGCGNIAYLVEKDHEKKAKEYYVGKGVGCQWNGCLTSSGEAHDDQCDI